jgi:hypothetical protein
LEDNIKIYVIELRCALHSCGVGYETLVNVVIYLRVPQNTISWLAELLSASQDVLNSTEIVRYLVMDEELERA